MNKLGYIVVGLLVGGLLFYMYLNEKTCKQQGGVTVGYYGMDCYNNKTHEFIN